MGKRTSHPTRERIVLVNRFFLVIRSKRFERRYESLDLFGNLKGSTPYSALFIFMTQISLFQFVFTAYGFILSYKKLFISNEIF